MVVDGFRRWCLAACLFGLLVVVTAKYSRSRYQDHGQAKLFHGLLLSIVMLALPSAEAKISVQYIMCGIFLGNVVATVIISIWETLDLFQYPAMFLR